MSASDSAVFLSWQEPGDDGEDVLHVDRWDGERWEGTRAVARGDDFFVNWADLPSVVPSRSGLVAHWLVRGPRGGYDYGIRFAYSRDGGRTWTDPWIPHEDGTHTEHGFVSLVDLGEEGVGVAWLDGRDFATADGATSPGEGPTDSGGGADDPGDPEMSLRFRTAGPDREPGPETLLDDRTCECCQTDAAVTSDGLVLVYRDRSPDEVRDVHRVRRVRGEWTEPRPVHRDGWVIAACPVNGPAVAARGRRVAVAWFTAAADTPRVSVAFSRDAGETFGSPVRVDAGNPAGRVDVQLLPDGAAAVSWLERAEGSAEIRIRLATPEGETGPAVTVGRSAGGRSSGFPRTALSPDGELFIGWTDARREASRVRTARVAFPGRPGEPGG